MLVALMTGSVGATQAVPDRGHLRLSEMFAVVCDVPGMPGRKDLLEGIDVDKSKTVKCHGNMIFWFTDGFRQFKDL